MGITILENEPFHAGFDRMPQHLRSVLPGVSDELLINPGMGFETYQRFNGDPTETRNYWDDDGPTCYTATPKIFRNCDYPDTSVAYIRWYWARLEPEQGRYCWEIIDNALAEAARRGQQLHMRIMPHDHTGLLPDWYLRKGRTIEFGTPGEDGRQPCVPDYADPLFRSATESLVAEAGRRYNGHPNLFAIDIGTLGFWGEWHNWEVPGNPMSDRVGRRWAVELYLKAFPDTHKIMLLCNDDMPDALKHAVSKGCGWRADCWGNVMPGWSHQVNAYPRSLGCAKAGEAWWKAPVCLESCWTFQYWAAQGWDIDCILSEALRWRASLIMAKSSVIPVQWQDKVREFQKRLGYRFVAHEITWPSTPLQRGKAFPLVQGWVNRGVAPCYDDFRLRLRLDNGSHKMEVELPHRLNTWMPDVDIVLRDRVMLPAGYPKGTYRLSLGICRPGKDTPAVKMANTRRTADGWLPISDLSFA